MARTLRNEDTPEGRAIWAAVDKAASRAPKWMKERIESLELNLPGAIKPREVGGMATRELCKRCWRYGLGGGAV